MPEICAYLFLTHTHGGARRHYFITTKATPVITAADLSFTLTHGWARCHYLGNLQNHVVCNKLSYAFVHTPHKWARRHYSVTT